MNTLLYGDQSKLKEEIELTPEEKIPELLDRLDEAEKEVLKKDKSWNKVAEDFKKDGLEWMAEWGAQTENHVRTQEDFIKANQKARDSVIDYNKSVRSAGIANSLKSFAGNALSFVGNIATGAILTSVASAVIQGTMTLIDKAYLSAKEAEEKAAESFGNFEDTKKQLSDVDGELDSTKSKIDELKAKGTLSFVDEAELSKLQSATQELDLQKQILEEKLKLDASTAASDSMTALEKTYGDKLEVNDETIEKYKHGFGWRGKNNISALLADISDKKAERETEVDRIEQALADGETREAEGLELNLRDINEAITEKESEVFEHIKKLNDYKDKFLAASSENFVNAELYKPTIDALQSTIDYVYKELRPESYRKMKSESLLSEQKFSNVKKWLDDYGTNEKTTPLSADQLSANFSDFVASLEEAEIPIESFVDNFNAKFGKLNFDEVKKQLNDAFESAIDESLGNEEKDELAQKWNEWVSSMGEDDLTVMHQIKLENDVSDWNINSWQTAFTNKKIDSNILSSFSDFVADEKSEKIISTYQEKMNALNNASAEFAKSGKLSGEALTNLLNAVPEASSHIGDLENGIEDLINTQNSGLINSLDEVADAMEKAGNSADATAIRSYASEIVSAANEVAGAYSVLGGNKFASPNFFAHKNAKETENAGDRYLQLKSIFEEANKAYQEGLVGTDDFKTAAALLSPNAMDDAANWEENYQKVERYFTDDSTGVTNFLNDLESKGLAECNEETGEWVYNIQDLQSAADEMGLSFEGMTAIFGRLEDYGFRNDFFGSIEEGTAHLGGLYGELSTAESKLSELKEAQANGDTTVTDTVIQAQEEKVNSIKQSILTTQDMLDQLAERSATDYAKEVESGKETANSLAEQYNLTSDSSVKGMILDDIESIAEKLHLEIVWDKNGNIIDVVSGSVEEAQEFMEENPLKPVPTLGETSGLIYGTPEPVEQPVVQVADTSQVESATAEAEKPVTKPVVLQTSDSEATPEQSQANPTLDLDTSAFDEKASRVNATLNNFDAIFTPKISAVDNASSTIRNIESQINSLHDRNISITTTHTTIGRTIGFPSLSMSAGLNRGTMVSHATGTAYNVHNLLPISSAHASGNDISIKKNQDSLLNELGQESIIRDGKWFLIPGGTQVGALKKGDIVINAKQTDALLKYGKVSSFAGNAYATGTFNQIPLMSANAYHSSNGGGGGGGKLPLHSSSGKGSVANQVSSAANTVSKNSKKNRKNTKMTLDKLKKWAGDLFDWIEVKLNYLEKKASNYYDSAQLYIQKGLASAGNYRNAESNLKKAISTVNSQLDANRQGYVRYNDQANTAYEKGKSALKSGDRRTFQDAVKIMKAGGKIDISSYNEKVRSALDEFQKWYDKSIECKYAITELNSTLQDYREELYNLPLEQAKEKIDDLSASMDVLKSKTDLATSGGSSLSNFSKVLNANVNSASSAQKKASANVSAKSRAVSTAKSALNSASKTHAKTENVLKSATKTVKKYGAKLGKKRRNQIANGEKISTRGLKGKVLSAAKKYNDAISANTRAENVLSSKKSAYSSAVSALGSANEAKRQIDAYYSTLKKQQDEIKKYEHKASYEYANYVAKQELDNTASQHSANLNALRQAEANATSASATRKATANAVKSKASAILRSSKSKKLSASQKKALKSGQIVSTHGVKDKQLLGYLNDYNSRVQKASTATNNLTTAQKVLTEAQQQATISAAELASARTEYAKKTFDNVKEYYDSTISFLEAQNRLEEKKLELSQAHGNYEQQSDFDKQLANRKEEMDKTSEQVSKLQAQLEANVKAGYIKKDSLEWKEMQQQIIETQSKVKDYEIEIENLKQQKLDAYYEEVFDRVIKKIDEFKNALGGIKDIISEEMMYDRDTGHLTETGMLSALINVQNLKSNISSLKKYTEKLHQIESDYKAGAFGQKEYDEKMEAVRQSLLSGIGDIASARNSIIEIFETLADKEREALLKIMNAHKDALKAKKDYSEYDKNIRNQTREINLLKQQIAALDGMSSAEERAKKAKLEAELFEKQQDLDETVKDHIYELKISGIEEFEQTLTENYEKYVYELKSSLDKMTEAIKNMSDATSGNVSTAIAQMNEILKKMGIDVNMSQLGVSGLIPHNASGTRHARAGLSEIDEHGREMIISPSTGRVYMSMKSGDNVIPHHLTENLWDLAKNKDVIMGLIHRSFSSSIPSINLDNISGNSGNINVHYDALINVEGNLDSVTGAEVIGIINKQLPKIYEYNVSQTIKDARKRGHK